MKQRGASSSWWFSRGSAMRTTSRWGRLCGLGCVNQCEQQARSTDRGVQMISPLLASVAAASGRGVD